MSLQVFSGSELEHLSVKEKLVFILKMILPIVKEIYRSNVQDIENPFSDSDGSSTQDENTLK